MKNKTALSLTLTALAASSASVFAAPPANDAFPAAQAVTVGATAGTTVEATAEAGEPRSHLQNNFTSVWFTFTPAATGLYTAAVVGTDATPIAHNVAVYTGSAVNALTRLSFGPDFHATAGVSYMVQVTAGTTAATQGAFSLTIAQDRPGSVVLPFFSNWEYLHPTAGEDPTADANWAAKWKTPGDTTAFGALTFSAMSPAPLGYETLTGAPGLATNIGTPTSNANNNAAYFRTNFVLTQDSSNLWAEVIADDGAYIYIDDKPGIPLRIAAKLTDASVTNNTAFQDYRPQTDVHITGAVRAVGATTTGSPGCRAYGETGFNVETQTQKVFLSGLFGKLAAGSHTVAVSLHQTTSTSSDLAFDLQIVDYNPRKLPTGGSVGLTFTDTPFVAASTTTTVVPVAEHHHAPRTGQTDIAWYCVSPTTRGATALPRGGAVVSDTTAGTAQGRTLRLTGAEAQAFRTEPIDIQGLVQFTASVKVRTADSSAGWEAADGFRIFLETSADGINFSEPAVPLELQPQVNGAAALAVASTGWVTKSLLVAPGANDKAVRLVLTGGTDSTSESLYIDDVTFATCIVTPTVSNVVFNSQGDDDIANDTVTFDLSVAGTGTTSSTFTTNGLGSEQTAALNLATIQITRPVTVNATGVRQPVTFKVEETGNPACFANVSVTPPACTITAGTFGTVARSNGASNATADDDTFSFTATATADNASTGWKLMSSNTADTTVYASGLYGGPPVDVTVPANSPPTLVFVDKGDANCKRNATLNLSTTGLAVGKSILNGVTSVIYAPAPVAANNTATWVQASTAAAADTEFTPDSTTIVLNNGNTANSAGTVASATGTVESPAINVTGLTAVQFKATLRAFETSTSSGFETNDVFKLEVDVTQPGGTSTVNLIDGNSLDLDGSKELNGFTGTTPAPYNTTPEKDEFNAVLALVAGNSRGSFTFTYNVPTDATEVRFRFIGTNNSTNEFFFVKEVVVADGAAPVDTDGDGLDDNWEIGFFGDKGKGATDDPDGDGSDNLEEYNAGTNPTQPGSVLAVTTASRDATNVTLTWQSVPGKTYRVQKSTGLATGTWTNVGAPVPAAAAPATTTSANAAHAGAATVFFRVVIP